MFANSLNCLCCSPDVVHPPPPPPCTITLELLDASSDTPIAGATVTVSGYPAIPGPTSVTGTTDSSGIYVPPDIPVGGVLTATITYAGVSRTITLTPADCGTVFLCYCTCSLHLTYSPSDATLIGDDIWGASFPYKKTGSGGDYTYTYAAITECAPSELPSTRPIIGVQFSGSKIGYVPAGMCVPIQIGCGDADTFDFALFEYRGCYLSNGVEPSDLTLSSGLACDPTLCAQYSGPDQSGLVPLTLQVRFTTGGSSPGACLLYGDDEGVWIDLPLASAPGTFPIYWSSGCRGGASHYVSQRFVFGSGTTSATDCPIPYETTRLFYASTRIDVIPNLPDASGSATIRYHVFGKAGCVPNVFGDPGYDPSLPSDFVLETPVGVCSVVNQSSHVSLDGFPYTIGWEYDFREKPCP